MADQDPPEVSVIIVSWDSKDRLKACLGSLAAIPVILKLRKTGPEKPV